MRDGGQVSDEYHNNGLRYPLNLTSNALGFSVLFWRPEPSIGVLPIHRMAVAVRDNMAQAASLVVEVDKRCIEPRTGAVLSDLGKRDAQSEVRGPRGPVKFANMSSDRRAARPVSPGTRRLRQRAHVAGRPPRPSSNRYPYPMREGRADRHAVSLPVWLLSDPLIFPAAIRGGGSGVARIATSMR